jgi:hypothetical protein
MKQLLVALTLILGSMPAFANAVFTLGNHPQPGEENIFFHNSQTGQLVNAFTQSGTDVQFFSPNDVLVGSGGQADLDSSSGLIHTVTITVPGHTFTDFILNPFKPTVNNDLHISVTTNVGGPFAFLYGDQHGNNFLTITTDGVGEVIDSITVLSGAGFQDLKQPRISGVAADAATPEPSSLALLGSGFIGVATMLRRKLMN